MNWRGSCSPETQTKSGDINAETVRPTSFPTYLSRSLGSYVCRLVIRCVLMSLGLLPRCLRRPPEKSISIKLLNVSASSFPTHDQ